MSLSTPNKPLPQLAEQSIDKLGDKASEVLDTAHQAAEKALSKVQSEARDLSDRAPGLVELLTQRIKELSDKSTSLAKDTTSAAKDKAQAMADNASERIRKDPLKAVLLAVAAGAAVALVASQVSQRRNASVK